jgi:hypothetical protein
MNDVLAFGGADAQDRTIFSTLRFHTRYHRCARKFMSAICIAAVVIF